MCEVGRFSDPRVADCSDRYTLRRLPRDFLRGILLGSKQEMGNPKDYYYEVLEISRDSSPQQVRAAYISLVKKWHPDKHPLSLKAESESKFRAITQAYNALTSGHGYRTVFGVHKDTSSESTLSRKKETKKETAVPKRASGFKEFSYSKTMNYGRSTLAASDLTDLYYSQGNNVVKARPGRFTSHSGPMAKRKPPPQERKLECTLKELCRGCDKEIRFTRDILDENGMVAKKQESQTIKVKPGWKKGTKITFEGLGDERPGFLPGDVIYSVSEKEHPIFKRVKNDLIIKAEVPLVNALTGWTFSFRHLTGEKMTYTFDEEVIFPGYEKVVKGQGMPIAGEKITTKGDLILKFRIVFPKQLSSMQRSELAKILGDTK